MATPTSELNEQNEQCINEEDDEKNEGKFMQKLCCF